MPRKKVEPVVIDPVTTPLSEQFELDHIHDLEGNCIKHRHGPRCGASGVKTKVFRGHL